MSISMSGEDVTAKQVFEHGGGRTKRKRRMKVGGLQPIYIPAEVPENDVIVTSTEYDLSKGNEEKWSPIMSAESDILTLSLATSTLTSGSLVHTADSSVCSGSGRDSIASSDMYGWEETLSSRSSSEQRHSCGPPINVENDSKDAVNVARYSRANSTKKGLLYKVLGR